MSKVTPRNGLITIRFIKEEESKTSAGIIIPATAGMNFAKARVIRVGRGIWDDGQFAGTDDLRPGMLVLVKKEIREDLRTVAKVTVDMKDGDADVSLINQQDIFAILEEDAPLKLVGGPTGDQPAHDASDDVN